MINFLKKYEFISLNIRKILNLWGRENHKIKEEFTDEFILLLAERAKLANKAPRKVKHYDKNILENSQEIFFKMKFRPEEFLSRAESRL